jgi:radical SAM superfamily enzyme YgiQ (UPF0313 family)
MTGVSYLKDGVITHAPYGEEWEFDELPIPARRHPVLQSYKDAFYNPKFKGHPFLIMMTSRGCAYKCRFCVPNSVSFARETEHFRHNPEKKIGPKIAGAQRVIAEFRRLAKEGFKAVMIVDDQFLWAKSRTLTICSGIRDLNLEWGCLSRANFLLDEEVLAALATAGCMSIDIGVESMDQAVLDDIDKELQLDVVHQAIRLCRKYKIEPKINIMFGTSPLETKEIIQNTVKQLKKMPVYNVMFSVATPFKGTRFYDYCLSKGYLLDKSEAINPLGKSMVAYPHLSKTQIEQLTQKAYRSFYLRPKIILHRLSRYVRPVNIWHDLKILTRILKQKM